MNTDLPALPEPAITPAMVAAYLAANTEYWRRIDAEPGKLGVWRNGTPAEATEYSLRAALAAQQPAAAPYAWIYWHPSDTAYDGPNTHRKEAVSRFTDDTRAAMQAKGWIFEPLYAAAPAVQPELTGEDTAEHVAYRRGFQHGGDMARAAAQQPARGREADRARFPDPAFNEWLDTTVTENGEFTVWHLLASTGDALAGWENRPHYVKEQPAEAVAPSTWSNYVADMIGAYLKWPVGDARIVAVAGIIERRRKFDPERAAPPAQQPTKGDAA